MARNLLVDAGFLVALLNRRDYTSSAQRRWHRIMLHLGALAKPPYLRPSTLLARGTPGLSGLFHRRALNVGFALDNAVESEIKLLQKYADVPMSLADASLVRMSETFRDPIILTTDSDLRTFKYALTQRH